MWVVMAELVVGLLVALSLRVEYQLSNQYELMLMLMWK